MDTVREMVTSLAGGAFLEVLTLQQLVIVLPFVTATPPVVLLSTPHLLFIAT